VGLEVLMAVTMKMAVFWFVALCFLAEVYELCRDTNCKFYTSVLLMVAIVIHQQTLLHLDIQISVT
jgi:hypothetical protein